MTQCDKLGSGPHRAIVSYRVKLALELCAVLVPAKTSIIFLPLKFVSVTHLTSDTKCNDLFIQPPNVAQDVL